MFLLISIMPSLILPFYYRKSKGYVWNIRHASVILYHINCTVMVAAAAYSDKEKPPWIIWKMPRSAFTHFMSVIWDGMTTESADQPLQSAGLLFTEPNARYRCASNDPSCSHGVVARPATAANMNQVPKGYCYSTDNNQIVNSECDKSYHCANSTAVVTLTNNIVSTPATFVSSITVPAGWRRIHNKGVINYIR